MQKEQCTLASGSGSFADSLLIPVNGKLQAESSPPRYQGTTMQTVHLQRVTCHPVAEDGQLSAVYKCKI